jgi:hypothetical protein
MTYLDKGWGSPKSYIFNYIYENVHITLKTNSLIYIWAKKSFKLINGMHNLKSCLALYMATYYH